MMKERLVISISTISGTRHWSLGKKSRRSIKVLACSALVSSIAAGVAIKHLSSEVDVAKIKQQELQSESLSLGEQLDALRDLKSGLETDLSEREERISHVSERLFELEKVLGFSQDDLADDLDSRLDAAAISSSVRMVMLTQIPSGSPVGKSRQSSQFGKRTHPVTKKIKMHRGLDFAVNTGTRVYAPADGVVEVTRRSSKGSGNFLRIQHSFGFSSSYSHLKSFKVKSGQFVQKGELIALSGNSGLSSGPHLHYEVRFVGRALDPKPFVNWGVNEFETIFAKERGIRWESLINRVERRVSRQLQLSSQKDVLLADNSN
jgi:murein DD-endopeptidase MepM/ murein hydrolase activator NlpD